MNGESRPSMNIERSEMKYFEILIDGYNEEGGVLHAPEDWPTPIAVDGEEVKNWQSLVLELRDGKYCHFSDCVGCANIVSSEFKALIESFIEKDFPLEFLPVKVKSNQYGDRVGYIMHFTKEFDIIDEERSKYGGPLHRVIVVRVDPKKVQGMHVFNCKGKINHLYVSDDVRKAIIDRNLDLGIEFREA